MRRRRSLFVTAAAVGVSLALVAPTSAAQAGSESDLVDRYTQVVYELDTSSDSPRMDVLERVVDPAGRVLETSRLTRGSPTVRSAR